MVLEIVGQRRYAKEAQQVMRENPGLLSVSALTVHLVVYFGTKSHSVQSLKDLLSDFEVVGLEPSDVAWAFDHMVKNDFEDALQVSVALRAGCEVFYTFDRNLYAAYKHLPNLKIKLLV